MTNLITHLLTLYWRITLCKESPENTPYSAVLCTFSILLFMLIITIQWRIFGVDFSNDLLWIVLASCSLALSFVFYTMLVLYVKKLMPRLVQTVTSLLMAHSFIHLLGMPLFFMDPYFMHLKEQDFFSLVIALCYLCVTLGLSVWQFVLTTHIYKNALNSTTIQAMLIAFGLIAMNILTLSFW